MYCSISVQHSHCIKWTSSTFTVIVSLFHSLPWCIKIKLKKWHEFVFHIYLISTIMLSMWTPNSCHINQSRSNRYLMSTDIISRTMIIVLLPCPLENKKKFFNISKNLSLLLRTVHKNFSNLSFILPEILCNIYSHNNVKFRGKF